MSTVGKPYRSGAIFHVVNVDIYQPTTYEMNKHLLTLSDNNFSNILLCISPVGKTGRSNWFYLTDIMRQGGEYEAIYVIFSSN